MTTWDDVRKKLSGRGLTMPAFSTPRSAHLSIRRLRETTWMSGVLPLVDGDVVAGTFGLDRDDGDEVAAQALGLGILSGLEEHFARPDSFVILETTVYVRSTPRFATHHLVADRMSELLIFALGERGGHCRTTIGVPSLALGAALEARCVVGDDES